MEDPDISKLLKVGADKLFSSILSDKQLEDIQKLRIKKAKKTKTKKKVSEVRPEDFILKDADFGEDGVRIDSFDVRRYMAEMEDPTTGTLHDLKIDTRDLPLAKNFYDYCFNLSGKKMHAPWSRQLWIGAMFHGEICPCCSKKEWLDIHNVPKDYPSSELPAYLCFLENGKCPKCKRTKNELIQHYGLKNYIQLVSVLGQRSGKSSSLATYGSYDLHRMLKFPNYASLTKSMQNSTELTATFVSLNFAKALGVMWTPFRKIVTE